MNRRTFLKGLAALFVAKKVVAEVVAAPKPAPAPFTYTRHGDGAFTIGDGIRVVEDRYVPEGSLFGINASSYEMWASRSQENPVVLVNPRTYRLLKDML